MAPEVALDQPYNLSVDTFSFGIIFWQICSLTTPFAGYSQKMHAEKVVRGGERPTLDKTWPLSWIDLMQRCWSSDPCDRPDLNTVVATLRDRYDDLSQEEEGGTVLLPTRANEIRAKNRKTQVAPDGERLDVDTRISTEADKSVKRFDGEVI